MLDYTSQMHNNFERIACKTERISVHPKEERQHDIKLALPLMIKDGHF